MRLAVGGMLAVLAPVTSASAQPFALHGGLPDAAAELLSLKEGWRGQAGDDFVWAEVDFDDSAWPVVPTWFDRGPEALGLEDVAWFRFRMDIPPELLRRELVLGAVHHGSIEVYLDGAKVLSRGRIREAALGGETAHAGLPRRFARVRFERYGEHVIAVRFATAWRQMQESIGNGLGFQLTIGSIEAHERAIRKTDGQMAVHLWFFGGTLFLSILYSFIYWFRRDRSENLYFAISALAVGLVAVSIRGSVYAEIIAEEMGYLSLFRFAVVWASFAYLRFVQELLFRARPARTWVYLPVVIVLSAGCVWIHVRYYYLFALLMLADTSVVLGLGLLTRQPGARLVALGGFGTVAATVAQLAPPFFGYEPFPSAFVWGFAFNFVVISWVLARSFARAQEELAAQMGRAVEQERRAKEEAIARRELEAENARQEVLLEEARRREEMLARLEATNRELKSTQTQLVQSGKMAALGQLVAGVAHEINTPTGAIASMHGSLERAIVLLRRELEAQSPELLQPPAKSGKALSILDDAAKVIGSGSERVTEIVKRLRTFARLDEAEFKLADLNEGLADTLVLVGHHTRHRVDIEEDLAELPRIPCFPSPLNQVFLNLIVNALQAIDGKGRVVIRSRATAGWIEVDVEDDGVGIPEENLERIFDPGFTTKGVRIGTGLGLSISYRIVQDHQGRIDVRSRVGEGTCFTVAIPTDLDVRLDREPEA